MIRKLLTEDLGQQQQANVLEGIFTALKNIQKKLEEEVAAKQATLEGSYEEIRKLRQVVLEKDNSIKNLQSQMLECQRNNDGNRQLINKLLNDLERMKQDVEWYKRTYEKRTLFGVIKDRIKL